MILESSLNLFGILFPRLQNEKNMYALSDVKTTFASMQKYQKLGMPQRRHGSVFVSSPSSRILNVGQDILYTLLYLIPTQILLINILISEAELLVFGFLVFPF